MATFRFNSKKSVDGPRQGNENDVVYIYTYVTEKTFDAYLFQLVETKQKFISQIMTSRTPVRSAEDVDEKALSYAEIKALAAGNPLILEKTQLDTDVAKLKLLKQSYLSEIYRLEDMIVKYYPNRIKELEDKVLGIEKDLNLVKNNTNIENEEKFSPMTLKGKQYNKKEMAGKTILEICKTKENSELEEIGEYRGMKLELQINVARQEFELFLKGRSEYKILLGNDIYGNITRIDNALSNEKKDNLYLEPGKEYDLWLFYHISGNFSDKNIYYIQGDFQNYNDHDSYDGYLIELNDLTEID